MDTINLFLHQETSLIFVAYVFSLVSSSTGTKIIPELQLLTRQILFKMKRTVEVDSTVDIPVLSSPSQTSYASAWPTLRLKIFQHHVYFGNIDKHDKSPLRWRHEGEGQWEGGWFTKVKVKYRAKNLDAQMPFFGK